ncbi:LacI family DNA-binding transcriptional regulator [Paenibacillus cremeus]|uniref:LacI family transcriptional regulator n=1 Tax=Paenibacillus cremeus TaxID=2163881 RepID=A0A559K792_9BACL|nr:LacI family DNA-binding transcriptional regulator [Paenibacillus cremeus]TVY07987.1 LacI family transcriptional regulator [Paenibacillus cremeus]
MKPNNPTIYDIASHAKVSKSTVSRVLNGKTNISDESRKRILEAIKELNYQPNKLARALTNSGFDAILVISRPSNTTAGNPFFSEVIQSIASYAENEDFDVIIQTSRNTKEVMEKCLSKIRDKMVRGIIMLSSPVNEDYLDELDKHSIPIAVIGKVKRNFNNIFSIDTNNFANSYNLVQHLIDNGHSDIACLHAPLKYNAAIDRVDGYKQCLIDNGIPVREDLIIDCGYSFEDAHERAIQLLQSERLPTAVFTVDELKIMSFYHAASQLGISIPQQVSIVGLSNGITPQLLSPPMTGIELPVSELGKIATDLLFKRIQGQADTERSIIVPAHLEERKSVQKIK